MANKKVFLYVGNNNTGGTYPTLTETDISGFNADEFVLTCGNYPGYLSNATELNTYLTQMITLAKNVIQTTEKFVWLGFPRPPAPTQQISINEYDAYADQYLSFAIACKNLIDEGGTNYYYNYVQGFYMNDEHVRRQNLSWGSQIDDQYGVNTNIYNLTSHPQIYMYNKVSMNLMSNSYGWKKLLWCPYIGYGANYDTTMIDIAYIANTTNIFNTVLLQPSHYFIGNLEVNLSLVKNSVNLQEVRRRDNNNNTNIQVVAKTSNTIIGCQMEIDRNYFNMQEYVTRYNQYYSTYNGTAIANTNNRIFSYYCDYKDTNWSATQGIVNTFFASL